MKEPKWTFDIPSPLELANPAAKIRELWRAGVVLRLSGGLGAGKTTLLAEVLKGWGESSVSSPTYAIHHRYATSVGPIDHLDLYRLESQDDLESAGIWDLFELSDTRMAIEWPERLRYQDYPRTRTYLDVLIESSGNHRSIYIRI